MTRTNARDGDRRRWAFAAIVSSLAFGYPSAAQEEHRVGIVGLLALPEVFGRTYCDDAPRREIPLYSAPEAQDLIGWIRGEKSPRSTDDCYHTTVEVHRRANGSVRELPSQEYLSEEDPRAAIVLEARPPWFKVRLHDGTAWLESPDHLRNYFPLPSLLGGAAYLTHAWDETLAERPAGRRRRVPSDPSRRAIGYIEPVLQESAVREQRPAAAAMRVVEGFERPEKNARVIARFEAENASGVVAASRIPPQIPVFQRRRGWFQIALCGEGSEKARRVWIEHTPLWRFFALRGADEQVQFAHRVWGREFEHVRVTEFVSVGDALWLHLELLRHSPDDYMKDQEPTVTARGWIPAHNAAGEVMVWFFTRD